MDARFESASDFSLTALPVPLSAGSATGTKWPERIMVPVCQFRSGVWRHCFRQPPSLSSARRRTTDGYNLHVITEDRIIDKYHLAGAAACRLVLTVVPKANPTAFV
jgi:hypothetical protein